jgi:class 3 adenylate cyclase
MVGLAPASEPGYHLWQILWQVDQRARAPSERALEAGIEFSTPPGGLLVPVETNPWFRQEFYLLSLGRTWIGRGSDCQIGVNHPSVSRHHCELYWSGPELMIAHGSSTNPTLVNGLPIVEMRSLKTGDRIEIAEGVAFRVQLFDGASDETPTQPRPYGDQRSYAILHTDVVSYSRLVEEDVVGAARQFERSLEVIRKESEAEGGRIENVAGDAALLLFEDAGCAVRAASTFLAKLALLNAGLDALRRMEFRVGIDYGDVLVTPSGNIYGETVNIATRIQALASPGAILVSAAVRDELHGSPEFRFEPVRFNELKNISRDVSVFRLVGKSG